MAETATVSTALTKSPSTERPHSDPAALRLSDAANFESSSTTRTGCLPTLMRDADIIIATTGRPGLIPASIVRKGQVVFALSNPEPEITPDDARAAGAAFAGDGRSINNALAFPRLFKGALEVRSRAITIEMLLDAAEAIAGLAETGEVVPSPLNLKVHDEVRQATARRAREQGLENTAMPKFGSSPAAPAMAR